ncbi:MAG: TPM domain-containing protein [Deltaproteobacteria bacterium]|nr:TPM domain-containing protein [Deltaproteobacteria bacterium]
MKNLVKNFLTDDDQEKIIDSVKQVEHSTSGEIVPTVVSCSYHYPMSDVIGGFVLALPLSLILTHFIGGWLWIGTQNMWLFLGIMTVLFIFFHRFVKHVLCLKRLFISKREIDEEVEEAALVSFFNEGLYRTRDKTGVLLFISVFEHRVWVLADSGINEKVAIGQWDKIVNSILEGIKQKRQADAICQAIKEIGKILEEHFPAKADDRNELKDLIIEHD